MAKITKKSEEQKDAEAEVEGFRKNLGPFVVAAESTRMAMVFTDATESHNPIIFVGRIQEGSEEHFRSEVLQAARAGDNLDQPLNTRLRRAIIADGEIRAKEAAKSLRPVDTARQIGVAGPPSCGKAH